MQVRGLYIDLDVIHGVAGGEPVFLLLEQDLLRRAEQGGMILRLKLGGAALLDGVRDLAGHGGGGRPLAAGVGKDVEHRKAAGPQKVQRLAEFLLRFAGEADNEVGRDGAAGEILPQQPDAFEIPRGIVPAVHPLQDGIRAGLQTQVELRAEIGVDAERLAEVLVDGARLQRAQADPDRGDRRAERRQLPSFHSQPQEEISMPLMTISR